MEKEEDFGSICVAFGQGKEVEVVMSDVQVLEDQNRSLRLVARLTLMPSSEKHGGTAEDSSSASDSKIGNFSTADMGMSPR